MLILDEPTRGIDVGAKYEIYTIINELAAAGKGVIVISSEMPELLGICDRIYVMNEGAFVDELPAQGATQEKIMASIMKQYGDATCNEHGDDISHDRPAGALRREHAGSFWKNNLRDYGLLLRCSLIMAFFQFVTGGTLLRAVNLTNLILQNSYIVIMALGMLLVIVGGHIDLSVGSVVGFVGALAAMLMVRLTKRRSVRWSIAGLPGRGRR